MSEWRKITEDVLKKAEINGTLASYYKDYKGEYICRNCYNAIVVNARDVFKEHSTGSQKRLKRNIDDNRLSISESISLLADIIYQRYVIEGNSPITKFSQLRSIIIDKDDRLNSFFDEIELGACIEEKNDIKSLFTISMLFNVLESEQGYTTLGFIWVDG